MKILPLSILGFFQYLAPTLQFLIGVTIFHEPFPLHKLAAFVLIWIAIAIFASTASARRLQPSHVYNG